MQDAVIYAHFFFYHTIAMNSEISHVYFIDEKDWIVFDVTIRGSAFVCAFEHKAVSSFLDKCEGIKTQEWFDLDHIIRSAVLMKRKHHVRFFNIPAQLLGHFPARVSTQTVLKFCGKHKRIASPSNDQNPCPLML